MKTGRGLSYSGQGRSCDYAGVAMLLRCDPVICLKEHVILDALYALQAAEGRPEGTYTRNMASL
jgi:hypothetical protein